MLSMLLCFLITTSQGRLMNETHLSLLNSLTRNCEVAYIDSKSGYGIRALSPIKYGDVLMIIPPNYVITSFDQYPWSRHLQSYTSIFSLICRLLYLKHMQASRSNQRILIDSFPSTFSTIFDLSEADRQYLAESFGGKMNLNLPIDCEDSYNEFSTKLHPDILACKECMKKSEFQWACKVALTRAYSISYNNYQKLTGQVGGKSSSELGSALMFGVDIFNHRPIIDRKTVPGKTHGLHYNSSPAHLLIRSDRAVAPGSEIFMSYGQKKNLELFLIHGIILQNNPDDYLSVAIPSDRADCTAYDQSQKICIFSIQGTSLSLEILNYLFYRLSGSNPNIISTSQLLSSSGLFTRSNTFSVLTKYRTIVKNYSLDRCKRSYTETLQTLRNLSKTSPDSSRYLINLLCKEIHLIALNHVKLLDQLLIQSLILPHSLAKDK